MRGRPKNSKNKPKFQLIELLELNKIFKENVKIPVFTDFLKGVSIQGEEFKEIERQKIPKIKFRMIENE